MRLIDMDELLEEVSKSNIVKCECSNDLERIISKMKVRDENGTAINALEETRKQ